MRKLILLYIASAVLFQSAPALAEDLTLPYPEFRPATPAYASSINANFEAVRSGVNSNNAGIVVNKGNIEANSNSIGTVKSVLASHSHSPADITTQGSDSGLDAGYSSLNHAHEDYAGRISEQEGRTRKLEGYGDLSSVLDEITTLQKTIDQLKSKIAELEKKLKVVSQKTE